jgi:hypothetical protein
MISLAFLSFTSLLHCVYFLLGLETWILAFWTGYMIPRMHMVLELEGPCSLGLERCNCLYSASNF